MATLIKEDEIRKRLSFYYNRLVLNDSKSKRLFNIESFNEIDRTSLFYEKMEKRLLLYNSLLNERIYIQYPGKESVDDVPKPLDFRPELLMESGKRIKTASFGDIWDVLDYISKSHKAYLAVLASVFLKIGYMHGYIKENEYYLCETIDESGSVVAKSKEKLGWYKLGIDNDIWYTLNDRIGMIPLADGEVSIEAFFKYVDLLFQNEDCKYFYKNTVIKPKVNYSLESGRNSSSDTNLFIINYLKGDEKMSSLVNSMSKGRGIATFTKSNYEVVTDGIVIKE